MRTRLILFILLAVLPAAVPMAVAGQSIPPAADSGGHTAPPASRRLLVQWNIAGQPATKILVRHRGWYRIEQGELTQAGLNPSADPHKLQLWVGGKQQPMTVIAQGNRFDRPWYSIGFYGVGLNTDETDTNVYYLIAGRQAGRRIQTMRRPSVTAARPLPSFPYTVETAERKNFFGYPVSATQDFVGQGLFKEPLTETLNVQNLDTAEHTALRLAVGIQGASLGPHAIQVFLNGTLVGTVSFSDRDHADQALQVPANLVHEGQNLMTLAPAATTSDYSYLFFDYVRLTYPHLGRADANHLRFQSPAGRAVIIGGFTTSRVRVLDITKPHATPFLVPTVRRDGSGYTVSVMPGGPHQTGTRTLLAFGQGEQGDTVERSVPSRLNSSTNSADYVIIAYHDFIPAVQPLVKLRQSQGMAVSVVDVDSVFNEFSYGIHDPQAIKDFLRYAQTHWKKAPHYVLLMGAGSFDPRNYTGLGPTDLVPARLIDTAYTETASDEWYVDFTGNHLPAMDIGRLPVRTVDEARTVIAKIVSYTPSAETRSALLVAGAAHQSDSFSFADATHNLAGLLSSSLTVQNINRNDGSREAVKSQIIAGINRGPLLVNYVGHGSVEVWDSNVLTSQDAATLNNGSHLPMFIMMTCLNGYFIDPHSYAKSLAEALLEAPHGGAVAVWSSTGETVPEPQAAMNKEFYRLLFTGPPMTLGDMAVKASEATTDPDVRQTWVMLGDPTMKIR